MRKKIYMSWGALAVCAAVTLTTLVPMSAHANSAQRWWTGTSSAGAVVTEEDCPLVVEHEELTFDVQDFPQNDFGDTDNLSSYTGKVTAEYTFYNPADYTVTATLVFPFGNLPMYSIVYDSSNYDIEEYDMDKYDILVDGKVVEKKLRHTFSYYVQEFDLQTDLGKLRDDYTEDAFFSRDMPVTKYTFTAQNVDPNYELARAELILSDDTIDFTKTKVCIENITSVGSIGDPAEALEIGMWASDGDSCSIYLIGQPMKKMPEWKIYDYENGTIDDEIAGELTLSDTETMTFQEFAMRGYVEGSSVSDYDWYNAAVDMMNMELSEGNVIMPEDYGELSNSLMRWYEYNITLEPGQRIVNKVTAPLYPGIDGTYEPEKYTYNYLLSPAQSWADFGSLNITVNTPYFMTESGTTDFTKTENGYAVSLEKLPEGELEFELCSVEKPKKDNSYALGTFVSFLFLVKIVIAIIVVAVTVVMIFINKRKRKI